MQAARQRATRDTSVRIEKPESGSEVQPAAGSGSPSGGSSSELVTDLLSRIEGTNRGVDCTPEQRQGIDGLIKQASGRSVDRSVGFMFQEMAVTRRLHQGLL